MKRNRIPVAIKESDEILKQLGAIEKDGKLTVQGKAHDYVLGLDKEVDELRARIPQDVKRLTEITGREGLKLENVPPPSSVIKTTTPEGKEVEFDLNKEREYWAQFYESHNLHELVKDKDGKDLIPSNIQLTSEQVKWVKEMVEKHGFNRMMICPPPSTQKGNFKQIKKEMGKPVKGLANAGQYSEKDNGVLNSDRVKKGFSDDTVVDVREDKPYIKLWRDNTRDNTEVNNEGQTAEHYAQEFKEKGLNGDTYFEYLLVQRELVEKTTGRHIDTQKWGWLLDSVIKDKDTGAVRFVLYACWLPDDRLVGVGADAPDCRFPDGGARASAILYL